jgi:hypothetical protein
MLEVRGNNAMASLKRRIEQAEDRQWLKSRKRFLADCNSVASSISILIHSWRGVSVSSATL